MVLVTIDLFLSAVYAFAARCLPRMCRGGAGNYRKHSVGWAGRPRSIPKSQQPGDLPHGLPIRGFKLTVYPPLGR